MYTYYYYYHHCHYYYILSHIYVYIHIQNVYRGTPKSSILVGFSIINHPFWNSSILGNPSFKDGAETSAMKGHWAA